MRSLVFVLALTLGLAARAQSVPASRLAAYAQRVTGMELSPQELQALRPLDEKALFERLYAQREFADYRVPIFVSALTNEYGSPFQDVDDFQLAMGLAVRDDLDFRRVFSRPFYIGSDSVQGPVAPESQTYLETASRTFSDLLRSYHLVLDPSYAPDDRKFTVANGFYRQGLFTTQGFGKRYLSGGTNRRAVKAVFNIFLCAPIETWRDASLDQFYIGKDVSRTPGDSLPTFMEKCAACHAPMDAFRGAWAFLNYDGNMGRVEERAAVADKYNQNADVYPDGAFTTEDASWQNLLVTPVHQERFGWPKRVSGEGVAAFADMVVNSKAFGRCMTKKVLKTFCDLTPEESERASHQADFNRLSESFSRNGYRMKTLIREVVKSDLCARH